MKPGTATFAWQDQITPEIFDAYLPLMLATEHWGDAIFNYFTYRVTAGYTESLNGLMKLLAREGRGFSFEVIRAKALLTNGLRKQSRLAYDKQRMTTMEHFEPPHADALSPEGLPAASTHAEYCHRNAANTPDTHHVLPDPSLLSTARAPNTWQNPLPSSSPYFHPHS
jgi:hypothetical protein